MGGGEQNYPKEKEKQDGKVVISESFTNSKRTERCKKQGREGKIYPIKRRLLKNSLMRQEGLLQWRMFNNRRKQQKGKDQISLQ